MKQTWASAVIAGVFACTAVLGAQSSTHRTATRKAAPQKEAVTVSGCLQDMNGQTTASAAAPATANTRAARSQASKYPSFMLANADNGGSYILQGMDLTREIGQRVEVTATEMPAPRTRATRGTSGSNSAAGNETQPAKHLWVTSVKMVSPDCSGAGQ